LEVKVTAIILGKIYLLEVQLEVMARKMETRSARLLALLLAIIMLGSVLAYAIKGGSGSPERNVKFEMGDDFYSYMRYLPAGVSQAVYMDLNTENATLRSYVGNIMHRNLDPYLFHPNIIQLTHGIERMMVASYPDGILYFIDVNKTKVYFRHDKKDNYMGYTMKIEQGLALTEDISPVVYGTSASVAKTIEVVAGNANSQLDVAGNYTERLPYDNYNFALVFFGDAAKELMKGNETSYIDFYFAGFRMNGSLYEKVVAVHFTTTGAFVKSNVTAYYNYTNYDDGFSVAVMQDTNFTKILEAQPEIRVIEIKPAE